MTEKELTTWWIGVDLDGTLAKYEGWIGPEHIGNPIKPMVQRIKQWLAERIRVKIFTARYSVSEQIPPVVAWLQKQGLGELEITNIKDMHCALIVDDRAVGVKRNTGILFDADDNIKNLIRK